VRCDRHHSADFGISAMKLKVELDAFEIGVLESVLHRDIDRYSEFSELPEISAEMLEIKKKILRTLEDA
jgi:hypothetical protein